jgi:ribosome-associated protein
MKDLRVNDTIVIPEGELQWSFSPSGGPGGQHANRASSRAQLRFDLRSSEAFDDATRDRVVEKLGNRAKGGVIIVSVDESRSQWSNRQVAKKRLVELLGDGLRRDPPRRKTKPSRSARRSRLEAKRKRSETKRLRGRPDPEA